MRRGPRTAAPPDRVSLSLPASRTSVTLAETAARGLLQHRNGTTVAAKQLASVSAELVEAGLPRSRPQDRLWIHYDVTPAEIVVTVEVQRRGRWQSRTLFRQSLAMTAAGVTGHPKSGGQAQRGRTPLAR